LLQYTDVDILPVQMKCQNPTSLFLKTKFPLCNSLVLHIDIHLETHQAKKREGGKERETNKQKNKQKKMADKIYQ